MNTLATPPLTEKVFKMLPARADLVDRGEIVLPALWKQLHEEQTFDTFFHDFPEMNFGTFVRVLSEPDEQVHAVCLIENDAIVDVCAIAMLTDLRVTEKVKRGLGNFLLFKKYWDSDQSVKIAALILDSWFAHLNTVAGVTPALNLRAVRFIEKMGFTLLGEIPGFASYRGESCGSITSYQTKSMWMEHREALLGA